MNEWLSFILSIASALVLSHLCSLLEAALLSITPSQLALLRHDHPNTGKTAAALKHDIEKPIAVILIINTAAHTIGAAIAGASLNAISGGRFMWLFSLIFTLLMVQYTELLPKTLGVRFNRRIMYFAARPLAVAVTILLPLIKLVHFFNRPFEPKKPAGQPSTTDEIAALAALARSSQTISSRQERIIKRVPYLSERTAEQIMIGVEQISSLGSNQSFAEAFEIFKRDLHTRYPVRDSDDPSKFVGYVNFKDLVSISSSNRSGTLIGNVMRPISFADPGDTASEILERFAAQHCHMMIVRDAKQNPLGLVTLEDIVEELLGDLDDEFDPLPRTFYSPHEFSWVVGGGVPMTQLARDTQLDLPRRAEPTSVWLTRCLDRPPRVGDIVKYGNCEFYVRKIRRGQVWEFNLKRLMIEEESKHEAVV